VAIQNKSYRHAYRGQSPTGPWIPAGQEPRQASRPQAQAPPLGAPPRVGVGAWALLPGARPVASTPAMDKTHCEVLPYSLGYIVQRLSSERSSGTSLLTSLLRTVSTRLSCQQLLFRGESWRVQLLRRRHGTGEVADDGATNRVGELLLEQCASSQPSSTFVEWPASLGADFGHLLQRGLYSRSAAHSSLASKVVRRERALRRERVASEGGSHAKAQAAARMLQGASRAQQAAAARQSAAVPRHYVPAAAATVGTMHMPFGPHKGVALAKLDDAYVLKLCCRHGFFQPSVGPVGTPLHRKLLLALTRIGRIGFYTTRDGRRLPPPPVAGQPASHRAAQKSTAWRQAHPWDKDTADLSQGEFPRPT
jgi:uncharacterized protein (DUF3820 family)